MGRQPRLAPTRFWELTVFFGRDTRNGFRRLREVKAHDMNLERGSDAIVKAYEMAHRLFCCLTG